MDNNVKIFKNLDIYNRMIDIILSTNISLNRDGYVYISKKESIQTAIDFFQNESFLYTQALKDLLKSKKIKFHKNNSSSFYFDSGTIKIRHTKTLEDSFEIVHELGHGVNSPDERDLSFLLIKEVVPILLEYRLDGFLSKTSLSHESKKQIFKNISENRSLAECARLELDLLNNIILNDSLNFSKMSPKLLEYYDMYKNEDSFIEIDRYGIYLFGNLISIYINYLLNSKKISSQEYNYLISNIKNMTLDDFSKILGISIVLDENGLYIPDSDLDKMDKIYKLEVRRYSER